MRSSLELAVDAAGGRATRWRSLLVDAPGRRPPMRSARDRRVAAGPDRGRPLRRRRGAPDRHGAGLWRAALELAGPDEGARALLARASRLVDEVAVPGDPTDLDTPRRSDPLARNPAA